MNFVRQREVPRIFRKTEDVPTTESNADEQAPVLSPFDKRVFDAGFIGFILGAVCVAILFIFL